MKNHKKYLYLSITNFILLIMTSILVKLNYFRIINDDVHTLILHLYSEISNKFFNLATFVASLLWITIMTIVLCIIFIYLKKYGTALIVSVPIIVSTIINNIIKIIIREPRPSYMPSGLESSLSFPSGHSMAAVTIYGIFIYLICQSKIEKKYKYFFSTLFILIICSVMISRIYLGAHYFNDIIGSIFASLWLIFLFVYFDQKYSIKESLNRMSKKVKK